MFLDPINVNGVSVDRRWITPTQNARLHLLIAHRADVCIIIRRKPSRLFHVVRWDTANDTIEHGSWFHGKLYPMRCDVSWDGHWMVYLAMGDDGETWNGLCTPPRLKTVADCPNVGAWAGGGLFTSSDILEANTHWHAEDDLASRPAPGGLTIRRIDSGGEDEPVLHRRLERDGWKRSGPEHGQGHQMDNIRNRYYVAQLGDDGWHWAPTPEHPTLRMWYRGYFERGRTFEFALDGFEKFLDAAVEWATWNHRGDLLVAREGWVRRYTLDDLRRGRPTYECDLNDLNPTYYDHM